ncbi:30S ribosome-binding factor RbfA [Armatimonas rosea]|uniref:Ribosome-binding factor A n=1 Tax=Armatimonas rosea TaxID=685828 RepID=A0A7W9SW81_ARMRO|nr:30S ribosome-binding factor RbfA [Armatimonas rosea]MBB6053054.1 ribosome-binding factor A [Armatimonas rosea]
MPTLRQARVAEMIKRDLSEILSKDVGDPRVALVSVTDVEVAQDFSIAKVFISVMGDESEKQAAMKALRNGAGFIRGRLGAMLELRTVPMLVFRFDEGIDRGVRMFELLREEKQFAESLPPATEEELAAVREEMAEESEK